MKQINFERGESKIASEFQYLGSLIASSERIDVVDEQWVARVPSAFRALRRLSSLIRTSDSPHCKSRSVHSTPLVCIYIGTNQYAVNTSLFTVHQEKFYTACVSFMVLYGEEY